MPEQKTPAQILAERRGETAEQPSPSPPAPPFSNLTVCCIFAEEHAHYLPDLLHSIAGLDGAKTIFGKTKPGFDSVQIKSESPTGKVVEIGYYGEFDYGRAKNTLLEMADTEWVLFLDSDERLQFTKQHFLQALNSGADGVLCHVVSPRVADGRLLRAGDEMAVKSPENSPQIRLFKSHFRYTGNIHEQILPDIATWGGAVVNSPIVINHIGYCDGAKNFKKVMRNIVGIARALENYDGLTAEMSAYYLNRLFAEYGQLEFLREKAEKHPIL